MQRTANSKGLWNRLGVAAVLLVAAWGPELPYGSAPVDLLVAVDRSDSMRHTAVADAVRQIAQSCAGLPTGSRLAVTAFASTTVDVGLPLLDCSSVSEGWAMAAASDEVAERAGPHSTNIEAGLRGALARHDGGSATAVVLVSDGIGTAGDQRGATAALRASGLPLYLHMPASLPAAGDAWIAHLDAPRIVRAGQRMSLSVTTGSDRKGEAELVVSEAGNPLARRSITLSADQSLTWGIDLPPLPAGLRILDFALEVPGDPRPDNNTRHVALEVADTPLVLRIARTAQSGDALATSLRQGGWRLRTLAPGMLPAQTERIDDADLIILDDIAIDDLSPSVWNRLAIAVERQGRGLVVLGGPNSFALGGYRGSSLERLLPVEARSSRPSDAVAVMLAIDTSGSMAQISGNRSRLAHARRAAQAAATSLEAADTLGVFWFDTVARPALPATTHDAMASSLARLDVPEASGGTAMLPAIEAGAAALRESSIDQRVLILITDGQAEESEDLAPAHDMLSAAKVRLLVYLIGNATAARQLETLASQSGGEVVRVGDASALPMQLTRGLLASRDAVRNSPAAVQMSRQVPFVAGNAAWPRLDSLAVTRTKPAADTYLVTGDGDPVLAAWLAGQGRVVALPGGLGPWSRAWSDWDRWPEFVAGMIHWSAAAPDGPGANITVDDRAASLSFRVDALTEFEGWSMNDYMDGTLRGPAGALQDFRLERSAPGRFEGRVPVSRHGVYQWSMRIDGRVTRGATYHNGNIEVSPGHPGEERLGIDPQAGVRIWSPLHPLAGMNLPLAYLSLRPPLLGLALIWLLIVIAVERQVWSALTSRLRRRL